MSTIISTIQKEQNEVIRDSRSKDMIIQGVAGSGKTSIALHRIAFIVSFSRSHYVRAGDDSFAESHI